VTRVRCAATTAAGLHCARTVEPPATHCHAHVPGGHETQVALASAGGRAVAAARAEHKRAVIDQLRSLDDCNRALERAAAMVCRNSDSETTRRAGVLIQAAREARELLKVKDLEKRLAALEQGSSS
jgi:hypothetical protein